MIVTGELNEQLASKDCRTDTSDAKSMFSVRLLSFSKKKSHIIDITVLQISVILS